MIEQINEIDTHLTAVMRQIGEAANRNDLMGVQRLTRKATELKELKEQDAAIRQRVRTLVTENLDGDQQATKHLLSREIRKLAIEVTEGDLRQNLLKLTPHIRRGKIHINESMDIEALPSGERFRTFVSDKGNKLRARGKISRFYKDANVKAGDFVLLTEVTPGRWTLDVAPSDEYSKI